MRRLLATIWLLGFLLVSFSVTAATAETTRQTLESFGFFGTWAVTCERPAAPENVVRVVYVASNGQVEFSETFGENYEPNIYDVLAADIFKRDTLVLRVDLNGEARQRLTMRRTAGRIRTITNQDVDDGSFVVRNAMIAETGQATPWLSHCAKTR
ncbi:MAG: hypothetical protein ACR2K5_03375 [Pseudolabrys sp.]